MMGQNATETKSNLPVIVSGSASRNEDRTASLYRYALPSDFASHLVAAKLRMMPQRKLRRAPVGVATLAYEDANRRKVRRMPAGYGLTLSA
ncbi:MAG: hypothetical protein H6873_01530 [Hyphomicrobiaceae bacterium]|nr:hypothetical protein [Hyphomicrobiaceae bacterium]